MTLSQLIADAAKASHAKGHRLGKAQGNKDGVRMQCKDCKGYVFVAVDAPKPMGSATWNLCKGEKECRLQ